MKMSFQKPLLKWVGGKTQILNDVLSEFPSHMNNYYEPFVGGGSVLFALLSQIHNGHIKLNGNVYASDLNERLINMYKNVQSNPNNVYYHLEQLKNMYAKCSASNKETMFYGARKQYNSMSLQEAQGPLGAAVLIFLNKTCFRGLYREGPNGFNVPFGNYKIPSIPDREELLKISRLIHNVKFVCCPFQDSLKKVAKGDFVYLDPPYAPESNSSFVRYTNNGFNLSQHKELFTICNYMKNVDIDFVMSNADVELIHEHFKKDQYVYKVLRCKRVINAKNPASKTNEVLIISI
jgi:DNA adenine methylase